MIPYIYAYYNIHTYIHTSMLTYIHMERRGKTGHWGEKNFLISREVWLL